MKYNKGFAPLLVALIVAGVLIVGGGAYYMGTKNNSPYKVLKVENNPQPETPNVNQPVVNNSHEVPTGPFLDANTYVAPEPLCNKNSPSTIKVISPNGGEVYNAGQKITIKWKSCNVTPNSIGFFLVKHDLSKHYERAEGSNDYSGFTLGGSDPYKGNADSGVKEITLPDNSNSNLVSGQNYFIIVNGLGDATHIGSGYSPRGYSDGLFTINKIETLLATIKLTSKDNKTGKVVDVKNGQSISVTLGNPGDGGYDFNLPSYDNSVLKLISHTHDNPPVNAAPGNAGMDTYNFQAIKSGSSKIEITVFRSWELGIVLPYFYADVLVK